ncbi:MAG: pseudouridine-5'-phosphate glycosidase [Thermoleophilia bacterium]|nr:pseudouridine-5'-phosphate glycosidase [Thermoleophilia bacterium]
MIEIAEEVQDALRGSGPVVALETTLVAHGFPSGVGAGVALDAERRVRRAGAVPATVGVLDGRVRVGLLERELERFAHAGSEARKVGPRDLAACAVQRALGATTVGGTLMISRLAGIRFLATGGVGGVHRGWQTQPDISADIAELARTPALVVSSGVKSLLDTSATAEVLESLGIPVAGFRTNELPLFYAAAGGPPASARLETADEAAALAAGHWRLGGRGLLVANPPVESVADLEPLIEQGLAEARRRGVGGQAVTPFVLSFLHERSGGRTLDANRRLIADNAGLAAEIAVAHAQLARAVGHRL